MYLNLEVEQLLKIYEVVRITLNRELKLTYLLDVFDVLRQAKAGRKIKEKKIFVTVCTTTGTWARTSKSSSAMQMEKFSP